MHWYIIIIETGIALAFLRELSGLRKNKETVTDEVLFDFSGVYFILYIK